MLPAANVDDIPNQTSSPTDVRRDVDTPSLALLVVGGITTVIHVSAIAFCLIRVFKDDLAWIGIPGVLAGLVMFVGGLNLRYLWSREWAHLGAIAALIPVSITWPVTLPVGIWVLRSTLNNPRVEQALTKDSPSCL